MELFGKSLRFCNLGSGGDSGGGRSASSGNSGRLPSREKEYFGPQNWAKVKWIVLLQPCIFQDHTRQIPFFGNDGDVFGVAAGSLLC